MSETPWRTAFPEAYQKASQLPLARMIAPSQWLTLCFESGLLQSTEYLPWATRHYGLACLNPSFFRTTSRLNVGKELYDRYRNHFNWGPHALPVAEWDGVLFVACIDPRAVPTHLDILCRPLLASSESLLEGWSQVTGIPLEKPAMATNPQQNPIGELPPQGDAPSLVGDPPPLGEPSVSLVFGDTAALVLQPMAESPPPGPVTTPNETLDPNKAQAELNPSERLTTSAMPETFASSATLRPPPEGNLFELDEGLTEAEDLSAAASPTDAGEANAFEMPEGLDFGHLALPSAPKPEFSTPKSQDEDPLLSFQPPREAPPPKAQTSPAMGNSPAMVNSPSMEIPPPKLDRATGTAPPPTIAASPASTEGTPAELEEELKLSFAKAYDQYRNLMILKLKDQSVVPIRWDASYKKPAPHHTFDLTTPSIFRITATTQKPFHGPAAPSTINTQFFDLWFADHTPAFLTLVPLFHEGSCIGMLLGASDKPLDRKESLHLLQETARKVEAQFAPQLAA